MFHFSTAACENESQIFTHSKKKKKSISQSQTRSLTPFFFFKIIIFFFLFFTNLGGVNFSVIVHRRSMWNLEEGEASPYFFFGFFFYATLVEWNVPFITPSEYVVVVVVLPVEAKVIHGSFPWFPLKPVPCVSRWTRGLAVTIIAILFHFVRLIFLLFPRPNLAGETNRLSSAFFSSCEPFST